MRKSLNSRITSNTRISARLFMNRLWIKKRTMKSHTRKRITSLSSRINKRMRPIARRVKARIITISSNS